MDRFVNSLVYSLKNTWNGSQIGKITLIVIVLILAGQFSLIINNSSEKIKLEAQEKVRVEADKKAKEEADKKIKEEADKKAKEEADKKIKEEADKKAIENNKRKEYAEALEIESLMVKKVGIKTFRYWIRVRSPKLDSFDPAITVCLTKGGETISTGWLSKACESFGKIKISSTVWKTFYIDSEVMPSSLAGVDGTNAIRVAVGYGADDKAGYASETRIEKDIEITDKYENAL